MAVNIDWALGQNTPNAFGNYLQGVQAKNALATQAAEAQMRQMQMATATRQANALQDAASKAQGGDYLGAQTTALGANLPDAASGYGKMDETTRQRGIDAATTLANAANGLMQRIPEGPNGEGVEQRRAAAMSLLPVLSAHGVTADMIQKANMTNAGLSGLVSSMMGAKDQLEMAKGQFEMSKPVLGAPGSVVMTPPAVPGGFGGAPAGQGSPSAPSVMQGGAPASATVPAAPVASGAAGTVGGNAGVAYSRLIQKGYTPQAAAGLIGNLQQESFARLDPNAFNPNDPNGGSHGIGQWNGPRFAALQAFAAQQGKPWTDLNTQVDFMDHELHGPEAAALQRISSAKDVQSATVAAASYVRPQGYTPGGNPAAINGWGKRLAYARAFGGGSGSDTLQGGSGDAQSAPETLPNGWTVSRLGGGEHPSTPAELTALGMDAHTPGAQTDATGKVSVLPEATNQAIKAEFTPQTIDMIARMGIQKGGQLPPMRLGKSGGAIQGAIYNRMQEIRMEEGLTPEGIVRQGVTLRADSAALQQLTVRAAQTDASEATAKKAGQFVLQAADGFGGTQYPLLNKALMAGRQQTGDARVDVALSRLGTYLDEYAKVIGGGTGSAAPTDAVRSAAMDRLSKASTPQAFKAVIASMNQEMDFRSGSLHEGIATVSDRIASQGGKVPAATAGQAPSAHPLYTPQQQAVIKAVQADPARSKAPQGTRANPFIPTSRAQVEKLKGGQYFVNPADGQILPRGG